MHPFTRYNTDTLMYDTVLSEFTTVPVAEKSRDLIMLT